MIRALIVDDEPPARAQVREFLSAEPDVLVVGESADGEDAMRQIRALAPDLLLMDIRMPRMSGLEVLTSSAEARLPYAIFTTAYADYAVDAFAVEALDYLVKPLERARFREAVERARRYLARDASLMQRIEPEALRAFLDSLATVAGGVRCGRLAVRVGRRVRFLEVPLIEHIRADGDYVAIHLQGDEVLRARDSIADLETRLPSARFLRIHRSLIVNRDCVKELRSNKRGGFTLVTASGHRLAAGATYASAVETLLAK
ncbi:MAG TPA: LytTR family DNA-binding domain-containing protein [Steroidobacteraceae bacterium]|nr:LytTR family DNA-binding domain-containing protein [Steroidobacteraceae bacterium]